ncbi:phBC6A51 family helix-turn-helix protein [Hoylesella saccharolytica]|uniref:phBC6A51 family helix-turn-helix protein n=1 Tax=Hoylesella saccharolytica TaxID=633701 RepID=UPI0028D0893F|nr:phBC6A51 family helix-turn-helix protein [Hoylesella saccharolytica]
MDKKNRIEQKATISPTTGLTPQQEQACILLASGESVTDVADKLSLNRGTLYKWQQNKAFECYYNKQCQEYKNEVKNGLLGLHQQAVATIKQLITIGSEVTRLKAATWVLDKVEAIEVGETNIRRVLKEQCTTTNNGWGDFTNFDEKEYNKQLKVLGLDEE